MAERFWLGLRQLLVAVDQLVYILIAVPIYVVAGGATPSADETISSRVGRAAIKGHRWGLVLEAIIDRLFILLGASPDHCRRNVETAFLGRAPKP
ncbi:hypothetical protein [Sphingomonas sp. Ant20]|uniref:hypothetical protein n=1 Tax=Sphingomonas sp. Ant20 TaxID=104605 RepID=UPI0005390538|nr:hypothetical protein [Sphingomonas sp. Ant20]KHA62761.1 hypothetical protein NI18_20885 [Sphingomonas sp. Ant20]